jgi:S1-C subfamily serine protease
MKRSIKHDLLLSLLSGLIVVNTITSAIFHSPNVYENVAPQHQYTMPDVRDVNVSQEYVYNDEFYRHIRNQTVLVRAFNAEGQMYSSGSGVILDSKRGIILTAHHVVSEAVRVKITTNDNRDAIDDFANLVVEDAAWLTALRELMFPPHTPQHNPMDPRPGIKRKIERQRREIYEKKAKELERKSSIFDLPHDLLFGKKKSVPETPEKPKVEEKEDKTDKDSTMKQFKKQDVAILNFSRDLKATSATFATVEPNIGDDIYVVGSPYGRNFFNTVSKGILSNKNITTGRLPGIKLYQTDAAVLPGNSGGPWFNSEGELVAMSTAWVPHSGTIGMGVPFSELKRVLRR